MWCGSNWKSSGSFFSLCMVGQNLSHNTIKQHLCDLRYNSLWRHVWILVVSETRLELEKVPNQIPPLQPAGHWAESHAWGSQCVIDTQLFPHSVFIPFKQECEATPNSIRSLNTLSTRSFSLNERLCIFTHVSMIVKLSHTGVQHRHWDVVRGQLGSLRWRRYSARVCEDRSLHQDLSQKKWYVAVVIKNTVIIKSFSIHA